MNTEYNDNYWMSNRQGTVGRRTDHSHDFVSTRNDTTYTNENSPVDPRRSFACATQPYGPYRYQSAMAHPMDRYCRVHWENFGPMRADNARDVVVDNVGRKSQPSEQPNRNGPGVARIRVRSLNSLNCSLGGLMPQQKQFHGRLNYDYNADQRQQNPAQKKNVPNYPPSLFEVNSLQSPLQNTARPPEPPVIQERFANAYQNSGARFFSLHHLNDIRQSDAFYGRSHSLLQLLRKDSQMPPAEPPRFLRHVRIVRSKSNVPPNVTDLNPSHTLENSLRQPSHKNPPSYLECSLRVEVPRGSQGSDLVQPALLSAQNNTSKPIEPPRATAVISNSPISNQLPELFTSTSVPENSKPEIANNDPSAVLDVAGCDTLKVKKEPSDFSCDSALDMEVHTVKSENIKVEDVPEDSNVLNSNNNVNDKVITDAAYNGDECQNRNKPNIDPANVPSIPKVEMPSAPGKVSSNEEPPAAKPNYKSEINRDKLHMLIEFLKGDDDKHADFMREIPSEKIKRQKEVDGSTKPNSNKPPAARGDMSISKKMPKVEIASCSSQHVNDVDSVKRPPHKSKDEQNPAFEKESGKNASPHKAKPQRDIKEYNRPKEKSEVKDRKPEKRAKPDTVTKKNSAEHGEKRRSISDADVTRPEKCIKVEKQVKQEDEGSSWTPGRNRNEETEHGQRTKSTEQQKCAEVPEGSDGPNPNLKYHFCEHCNLVSPIEYFWANAVSGEMKCLNCFKLMNLNSTEEIFKLTRDGKVQETTTNMGYGAALNPKSAISNESENPTELGKPLSRSVYDSKGQSGQRGKRKHAEDAPHERRVKRRKPEEKCEKKTSESQTKKSKMQSGSECSKSKQWKSSSDVSLKRERSGKNSSVDATERHGDSEATKKRGNSKEEPKKVPSVGERYYDYIQKYMEKSVRLYEKMKKSKEMNDHKAEWEKKVKSAAEDKKESDESTKALKEHRRHRKKHKKEMERRGKEGGDGRRRRDENEVGPAERICHQRRLSSIIEDLALKKICREVELIKRCVSFHGEESSKSSQLFAQLEKTTQKALNLVRSV